MAKEEKTGEIDEMNIDAIVDTLDDASSQKGIHDNFLKQVDYAGEKIKLDAETRDMISGFGRIVEIDVPFILEKKFHDKQVVRILSGFRIQHSNKRGPYFGGVRFYPKLNIDEAKALAALTTIKTALLDLPFGGSAGGVTVNHRLLSKDEARRVAEGYTKKVCRFIGPNVDVLIADRGVDGKIIGIMADAYEKLTKDINSGNAFLGRMLYGKIEPVSLGAMAVLDEFLKKKEAEEYPGVQGHENIVKPKTKELRILIQGFGFVGSNIAALLHQAGHKIIAITDAHGGTASIKGIDPRDALYWKKTHGTVKGMKGISITNEQLLKMNADILILAGIENQITEENALQINTPIILEIANFSVTPEADRILYSSGKTVIPDVVANTGSIIAGNIELMQNKGEIKKEKAEDEIKNKICSTFKDVYEFSVLNRTSMKNAAFVLALGKFIKKTK